MREREKKMVQPALRHRATRAAVEQRAVNLLSKLEHKDETDNKYFSSISVSFLA